MNNSGIRNIISTNAFPTTRLTVGISSPHVSPKRTKRLGESTRHYRLIDYGFGHVAIVAIDEGEGTKCH